MPSTQSNWYVRFGCLAPIIGIAALVYFLRRDALLPGFIFFAAFFGFAVLFLALSSRAEEKVKAKQLEYLETFKPAQSSYEESHAFISFDLLSKIAVDEKNNRLHFWEPALLADGKRVNKAYFKMPYILSEYSYGQLLAIEIYENGVRKQAVIKDAEGTADRIEAIGQSVEPVVDKKVSMVKKSIHRRIATVEMKIIMDDETKPVHVIRFYSSLDKRIKRDSSEYIAVKRKLDHWISLLSFVMDNRRSF